MGNWWYGDRDWFAVDAVGHLAAFITAGEGDVPTHILARHPELEEASEIIMRLPVRGCHDLLHHYPRPVDFIDYASRGIYAYDWMEVHMSSGKRQHYYLIARPQKPVTLEDLPPSLREVFSLVRFESLLFADSPSFCIRERLDDVTVA